MCAAALATVAVWFGIEQRRIAEVRHDLRDACALGALAVALDRKRGKTRSLLAAVDDAGTGRTDVDELVRMLFHSELKDGVAAAA